MNRIMVVGCCGAGKSTISRKLHEKTGIPLFHLDQYYHQPNWEEPSTADWIAANHKLVEGDQWIIDGNYNSTMDIRMAKADAIIFMDYPTIKCFWRVITRIWKYHGQVRPDMPEGCPERFDLEFLHYVATFGYVKRPGLLKKLAAFGGKKVIIPNDRIQRYRPVFQ